MKNRIFYKSRKVGMNNDCYLSVAVVMPLHLDSQKSHVPRRALWTSFTHFRGCALMLQQMCLRLFKRLLVKSLSVHCIGKLIHEDLGGDIYVSDFISFVKVDGEWDKINFFSLVHFIYFWNILKTFFYNYHLILRVRYLGDLGNAFC